MFVDRLYIKALDEVDKENLTANEVRIRTLAKHSSRFLTIIGYLMILPFLIMVSVFDRNFYRIIETLIINFVIKPSRYTFYYLIYLPLKLIIKG